MKLKYLSGTEMATRMNMEERLWDHIDGLGDATERAEIERLIASDPSWRSAYDAILDTQHLLKSTELEQPPMRFTKNVMEAISKLHVAPAASSYINKRIIWAIGGFFVVLIFGVLAYGVSTIKFSAGSGVSTGFKLPNVDFSFLKHIPSTVWTAFLMADCLLGLLFLDRYLRRKNEQQTSSKV